MFLHLLVGASYELFDKTHNKRIRQNATFGNSSCGFVTVWFF